MKEMAEVQFLGKQKERKVGNDAWRARGAGLKVSREVTQTKSGGQEYLLMENLALIPQTENHSSADINIKQTYSI